MRGAQRSAFALAAIVTITPWHSAGAIPAAKETWTRVRTTNFVLIGNAGSKQLGQIGIRLERFRGALQGGRETDAERVALPTTIVVFKDEASFVPYKLRADGKPANYQGVFLEGRDGSYIGMNGDVDPSPYEVIYHEYEHYFLSRRYGDVPLWLDEGLAEYYTTFEMSDDVMEIGKPVERHVRLLLSQKPMPLVHLFAMDTRSQDYSEGERQGLFYAQSWALVHYMLLGNPDLQPKLQNFLSLTSANQTPTSAFKAVFGSDSADLEAALAGYIGRDVFNYQQIRVAGVRIDELVRAEPVTRADLLYTLGDYLVHVAPSRSQDAEDHFREALKLAPDHARAHARLAELLEERGQRTEAEMHYEQAIELAGDDDLPFFLYGMAKLEHFSTDSRNFPMSPTVLPQTIMAARGLLGRCLELRADFPEATAGLGRTYLYDPDDVQVGIAALEQARGWLPARMDIAYYEMMLCVRAGDRDGAKALARLLLAHAGEPQVRTAAKEILAQDDSTTSRPH